MIELTGILHPLSFQHHNLLQTMSLVHPGKLDTTTYRNLELGAIGTSYFSNDKGTIFLGFDGQMDPALFISKYEKEGEEAFKLIDGPFVALLFDKQKEALYLIRDRFGKKVIYWTQQGDTWLVSTEIKGLLATGLVPQTPSPTGLASYLFFGFQPQEFAPILGVNKLLPGHFLKLDLTGHATISSYYSLGKTLKRNEPLELLSPPKESVPLSQLPFAFDAKLCIKELPQILWHLEEPISDFNIFRTWNLREHSEKPIFIDDDHATDIQTHKLEHAPMHYKLARLPKPLLDYGVLPFTQLFYPKLKWRILRNIDINPTLISYLSQGAIFESKERKKISTVLYPYFDPEIFIERFHHLPSLKADEDRLFYLKAKTFLSDSFFFQYEKLLPNRTIIPLQNYKRAPCPSLWCDEKEFRDVFSLLGKGLLVEEGFISSKWIRHHLGFPYIIPQTFKKLFTLLVLEIWFRLFIHQPITKVNWNVSTQELLG